MGYVLAACAAVLLVVLILTRRSAEKKLSPSRPEAAEVSEQPGPAAEDDGIPPEIVAAIAAAVTCMAPGVRIASLRRASARPRSVWQTAGLLENTRPF